jgi:hypothetical protein
MNSRESSSLWVSLSEVEAASVQGGYKMFGVPLLGPLSGKSGGDDSFRLLEEDGVTQIFLFGRPLLPKPVTSATSSSPTNTTTVNAAAIASLLALPSS